MSALLHPGSRTDLSQRCQVSPSTTERLAGKLVQLGLIVDSGLILGDDPGSPPLPLVSGLGHIVSPVEGPAKQRQLVRGEDVSPKGHCDLRKPIPSPTFNDQIRCPSTHPRGFPNTFGQGGPAACVTGVTGVTGVRRSKGLGIGIGKPRCSDIFRPGWHYVALGLRPRLTQVT